jgi:hypothetical protein
MIEMKNKFKELKELEKWHVAVTVNEKRKMEKKKS